MDFFDMDVFMKNVIKKADMEMKRHRGSLNIAKLNAPRSERVVIEETNECINLKYQNGGGGVGGYLCAAPLTPEQNYFELKIIHSGVMKCIAIGLSPKDYKLRKQPGWKVNSIGYHADDGMLYMEGNNFDFGPQGTQGDTLGCGIDFGDFKCLEDMNAGEKVQIFFTRNLKEVGKRVWFQYPSAGLYPMIGLHSDNEHVALYPAMLWTPPPPPMAVDSLDEDWHVLDDVVQRGDTLDYAACGSEQFGGEQRIALAIAKLPLCRERHYFEVELLATCKNGAIAIGLAEKGYPKCQMPGWKKNSVGYHSDDGKLFVGHGRGLHFGPQCEMGDRMGCGIQFERQKCEMEVSSDHHHHDHDAAETVEEDEPGPGCSKIARRSSSENDPPSSSDSCNAVRPKPKRIYRRRRKPVHDDGDGDAEDSNASDNDNDDADDDNDADSDSTGSTTDLSEDQFRAEGEYANGEKSSDSSASSSSNSEAEDEDNSDANDDKIIVFKQGKSSSVQIYFTKNGEEIGTREMSMPPGGFFPTIGMLHIGDRVRYDLCPLSG